MKLKLKKNKSKINADNSENPNPEEDIDALERKLFRKEKIEFGDIVHKPPSLNTEKLDKLLKSKKVSILSYAKINLFFWTSKKSWE